ncbi:hypothetical protein [Nocardia bhagyanarayanae]|nr:hypothetical protein [Nocardia bhagyanarayanae]
MIEMVALTVVREHRLAARGITTEPDPAAAEGLRRNLNALWSRAHISAAVQAMHAGRERPPPWRISDGTWRAAIEKYRDYNLQDLDALWRDYTTPRIADRVRNSMASLRRAARAAAVPPLGQDPSPANVLFGRARYIAYETLSSPTEDGIGTANAIHAAWLGPDTCTAWDEPEIPDTETSQTGVHYECASGAER